MEEFIRNSVEFRNFGFNILTLSFFGTVFFSLLQMWSLYKQGRWIWEFEKGESVSVLQYGYFAAYLLAIIPYGIFISSLALVLNGFVAFFCIYIVVGLWKYKKNVPKYEWGIVVALFFIFPTMIVVNMEIKTMLFSSILFGILIFSGAQLREIWKSKSAGNVDEGVQKVFIISSAFWFFYSIFTSNVPLVIFNPVSILINGTIVFLCKKYRLAT